MPKGKKSRSTKRQVQPELMEDIEDVGLSKTKKQPKRRTISTVSPAMRRGRSSGRATGRSVAKKSSAVSAKKSPKRSAAKRGSSKISSARKAPKRSRAGKKTSTARRRTKNEE